MQICLHVHVIYESLPQHLNDAVIQLHIDKLNSTVEI